MGKQYVNLESGGAIRELSLNSVKVGSGHRKINLAKVNELADSIEKIGLLQPILITPEKELAAGLHRLEACKMLGYDRILAKVLPYGGLLGELARIDENLIRNELSVLQKAFWLKHRREIYEELFPVHRHGGPRRRGEAGSSRQNGDLKPRFSLETAETMGVSERKVQRLLQIAVKIDPAVVDQLEETPLADDQGELLALANLDHGQQAAVVAKILAGAAGKVLEALALLPPPVASSSADESSEDRGGDSTSGEAVGVTSPSAPRELVDGASEDGGAGNDETTAGGADQQGSASSTAAGGLREGDSDLHPTPPQGTPPPRSEESQEAEATPEEEFFITDEEDAASSTSDSGGAQEADREDQDNQDPGEQPREAHPDIDLPDVIKDNLECPVAVILQTSQLPSQDWRGFLGVRNPHPQGHHHQRKWRGLGGAGGVHLRPPA
ncbi:MAG: hypothetical protein FJ126_13720 [Deltaproteobacteria bacterium]|nr:hypothetical protein [Deltaproteobacteria bacterium]